MTRKKFEAWMTLSLDATNVETNRKIKALSHSALPGPYIQFHGHKFVYNN